MPRLGDIIFQSSPHSDLVDAIEGATESKYSHVGILVQKDNRWFVREALREGVCDTPLQEFVDRGRDDSISVFRVKKQYEKYLPLFIEKSASYLGRPYDVHYLLDDEHLYCSELVYKSFKDASGLTLGKLQRFGDLKWGKYKVFIEKVGGGAIPTDRLVITPVAITKAKQLKQVYSSY
ncbi:MAG: hypothetical protein JXQ68_04865 [Campylobacterales bacterium]|nr:hypothetical protein [Campylobacterales bacterium]